MPSVLIPTSESWVNISDSLSPIKSQKPLPDSWECSVLPHLHFSGTVHLTWGRWLPSHFPASPGVAVDSLAWLPQRQPVIGTWCLSSLGAGGPPRGASTSNLVCETLVATISSSHFTDGHSEFYPEHSEIRYPTHHKKQKRKEGKKSIRRNRLVPYDLVSWSKRNSWSFGFLSLISHREKSAGQFGSSP